MPIGHTYAVPPDRIALLGFMGAGKTTVGRELARRLKWAFVDVDDVIVERAGRSIAAIFAADGEACFREMEHAALRDCLHRTQTIIALGGGAVETPANLHALAGSSGTLTIYLRVPLETSCSRCEGAAGTPNAVRRPVFEDRAALADRYSRRLPLYQRAAHWTIEADDPADVVTGKILEFWSTTFERSR